MIKKGTISSIDYENRTAKVKIEKSDSVTLSLCVPEHININSLQKEKTVACVIFGDGTGAVICELWRG